MDLEFWFDYSCPYAYLGSTQVEALAKRTGAHLRYCPMLLGGVFRAVGTPQSPAETTPPAKLRYNDLDVERWARYFGVPFQKPSFHPARTVEALRVTLATGLDRSVIHGFFRAYWVEGVRPSDDATVRRVLEAAGIDPEATMARSQGPEIREELRTRTDEAIRLGIFGAPTFRVGDQLFWGQDRMDFVERALTQGPES